MFFFAENRCISYRPHNPHPLPHVHLSWQFSFDPFLVTSSLCWIKTASCPNPGIMKECFCLLHLHDLIKCYKDRQKVRCISCALLFRCEVLPWLIPTVDCLCKASLSSVLVTFVFVFVPQHGPALPRSPVLSAPSPVCSTGSAHEPSLRSTWFAATSLPPVNSVQLFKLHLLLCVTLLFSIIFRGVWLERCC